MLNFTILSAFVAVGLVVQEPNIAGTWVLQIESHQIGLELEQDGAKLQGTLQIMGRNILVDGEFTDRSFTLTSEQNAPSHGGEPTSPVKITGKLKDDGTMEGDLSGGRRAMRWTGERLKRPHRE